MKNFKGKLSYIFSLYNEIKKDDLDIILKSGLKKTKLQTSDFNFIFSPFLFNEKTFEIIDPINNNKAYLYKPKSNFYKNYIYSYNNYTKNIFMIGGINNLIPLFEFLYLLNQSNKEENKINLQTQIFDILLNLIKNINFKSQKNLVHINQSKFYKYISLYIENLDKDIILRSLYINKILEEKANYENSYFYSSIVFNFKIIEKYSIEQKEKFYDKLVELMNEKIQEKNKNKENMFLYLLFKN